MKAMVGVVAIACAVGCSGDSLETAATAQQIGVKCPNPDDCTMSNGGGVYTEECGNAHLGSNDFMITRFVDIAPGSVTIEARAHDPSSFNYVKTSAEIVNAHYQGSDYSVHWVKESLTAPEFDLGDTGAVPVTGFNIVHDHNNGGFELYIKGDGGDYTLTFWNPVHEVETIGGNTFPLNSFEARWNSGFGYNENTAQPYCHRAPDGVYDDVDTNPCPYSGFGSADTVVFQGGIKVDAVKGKLIRDSGVTFSCRQGAIASVRSWGYKYRGTDDDLTMFEAAIQMKRASYCGDEYYFTKPHTDILIKDDIGNLDDAVTPTNMEAAWGSGAGGIHARCVNHFALRHKELLGNYDLTCGGTVNVGYGVCPLSGADAGSDGTGHLADRRK